MSRHNEAQIEADAELARRLQQEEFGGVGSPFGMEPTTALERILNTLGGPRLPDRTAVPDPIQRLMEQRMAEMAARNGPYNNPSARRAPTNGRSRGGADSLDLETFVESFLNSDAPPGSSFFFQSVFRPDGPGGREPEQGGQPTGGERARGSNPRERFRRQPEQGPHRARTHFRATFTRPTNGSGPVPEFSDIFAEMLNGRGDMEGIPGIIRQMMESLPGLAEGNPTTYEEFIDMIERRGSVSRGATDEEISSLPTSKYEENRGASSSGAGPSSRTEERDKCAICLGEYEQGEEIKRLPCNHLFHDECVSRWLKVNKTCPCCKTSIRPETSNPRR